MCILPTLQRLPPTPQCSGFFLEMCVCICGLLSRGSVWPLVGLGSSLCNQSPIYGHLGPFQVSALIKNAERVFLYTYLFMLL